MPGTWWLYPHAGEDGGDGEGVATLLWMWAWSWVCLVTLAVFVADACYAGGWIAWFVASASIVFLALTCGGRAFSSLYGDWPWIFLVGSAWCIVLLRYMEGTEVCVYAPSSTVHWH